MRPRLFFGISGSSPASSLAAKPRQLREHRRRERQFVGTLQRVRAPGKACRSGSHNVASGSASSCSSQSSHPGRNDAATGGECRWRDATLARLPIWQHHNIRPVEDGADLTLRHPSVLDLDTRQGAEIRKCRALRALPHNPHLHVRPRAHQPQRLRQQIKTLVRPQPPEAQHASWTCVSARGCDGTEGKRWKRETMTGTRGAESSSCGPPKRHARRALSRGPPPQQRPLQPEKQRIHRRDVSGVCTTTATGTQTRRNAMTISSSSGPGIAHTAIRGARRRKRLLSCTTVAPRAGKPPGQAQQSPHRSLWKVATQAVRTTQILRGAQRVPVAMPPTGPNPLQPAKPARRGPARGPRPHCGTRAARVSRYWFRSRGSVPAIAGVWCYPALRICHELTAPVGPGLPFFSSSPESRDPVVACHDGKPRRTGGTRVY